MIKKTIIPRKQNTYSSFPTLTTFEDQIFLFYRQGTSYKRQMHGLRGRVNSWSIKKEILTNLFNTQHHTIYNKGYERTVFQSNGQNELDSIVSKINNNLYSLTTRIWEPQKINQSYISISSSPHFTNRLEVNVPELQWFVFYGKAFSSEHGYIFPAYGSIHKEPGERPFLLSTNDFINWRILSTIELNKKYILNESSILYHNEKYHIFMRDNVFPFAIWHSTSKNLINWSVPVKKIPYAHAPMGISHQDKVYLSYRDLSIANKHATSIIDPFSSNVKPIRVDEYIGNLYDGGYSDLLVIDNSILSVHYSGNTFAEPYIKTCLVPLEQLP
ncbi:hypothetical protein ACFSCX_09305 [Bacillus salitolerans]|uniref:Glycosyl hydrolase family 32 N-terminal domain-containing protein n=1 Tax=Bacillus salitolerans TaxID=1437434 RepID=A0ABW4LPZ6_9BACI